MRHHPRSIEAALAPLVGLPLWASGRAGDLQWFQFGAKHAVVAQSGSAKGTERTVGDYALHVQCAWRIDGEHWRLLQPARDVPHFVMSGAGIDA